MLVALMKVRHYISGNEAWAKSRQKAAEKIRDVAAELLDVYAQRERRKALPLNMIVKNFNNFPQPFLLKKPTIRKWQLMR